MSYALASPHFELIEISAAGVGGLVAALAEKDAQIETSEWGTPQASQSSVSSVLRPARDWTTAASPGSLKTAVPLTFFSEDRTDCRARAGPAPHAPLRSPVSGWVRC